MIHDRSTAALSPPLPPPAPPGGADRWLTLFRSACASAEGGVVRRRIADVDAVVGADRFVAEVRARGWRVARNADQYVVFCNREPVVFLGD
jgi:hypothetical protein